LSFGFLALPIWLIRKDLKKLECGDDNCPVPKDHTFKKSDRPWLLGLFAAVIILSLVGWDMLKTEPIIAKILGKKIVNPDDNTLYNANVSQTGNQLIDEVTAKVLPEKGFQSKIALGDSVVRLAQNGVIDRDRFLAIYKSNSSLPAELKGVLDKSTSHPILLTRENANYYVNLLWPLGLTNYMSSNKESPISGKSLFNSFWFPHNYIQTALYFKAVKNVDWEDVDPKLVMDKDFSSIGGWLANVDSEIKKLGLIPQDKSGSNCGV